MTDITIPINSMKQLSTTLRDARHNAGLTQAELADMTNVSRPWINQLEQGRIANPSMQRILAICDALHMRITMTYTAQSHSVDDPSTQSPRPVTIHDPEPKPIPVDMTYTLPKVSIIPTTITPELKKQIASLAIPTNIPGLDEIKRMAANITSQASAINNERMTAVVSAITGTNNSDINEQTNRKRVGQ